MKLIEVAIQILTKDMCEMKRILVNKHTLHAETY